ncbi:VMO1 protein, partial [Picathartes gymnocephalus]|nr:VMO1 protein [Picathartes gymnocephalus]
MQLLIPAILCLLGSCCLQGTEARRFESILTVPNGAPWGSWGHRQFCPSGYAKGFELKVSFDFFRVENKTCSETMLFCSDRSRAVVFSSGRWGNWTEAQLCSSNKLVSFSLRVARWQYLRDNTAANNVRFTCSNGTQLEGWGLSRGHFSPWSSNCTSGAICGLQTKVEKPQGKWDDTALNDLRVFCCQ